MRIVQKEDAMDFEVQLNQLKKCVFLQDAVVQKLLYEKYHLNWLSKSIDSNLADVKENIRRIELQLHRQAGYADQLKQLLEIVQKTYERAEDRII